MAEEKAKDDPLNVNEAGVTDPPLTPPLDYVFGLPTDPTGVSPSPGGAGFQPASNPDKGISGHAPNSESTDLVPIPTSTEVVPNPLSTEVVPNPLSTDVVPNPASTNVVPIAMGTDLLPEAGSAGVTPAPNANTAGSAVSEPPGGVSPALSPNIETSLAPVGTTPGVIAFNQPAGISGSTDIVPTPGSAEFQSALAAGEPSSATPTSTGKTVLTTDEKFSVDEVIGFGWRSMTKYFWPLVGILTSNYLVQSVPAVAVMVLNYTGSSAGMSIASMMISLFGLVLNMIISLGTITLWVKICDGETITTRDVYSKMGLVWRYAAATFLYGSMVVLGYLCLIVPGVYLQLRFQFYGYFIVESEAGPLQALKASYGITKGSVAELFFLTIINYFIGWVGWMILFVGIFPAQVIQNVALARTYRLLRSKTPESDLPPGLQPIPMIIETESSKNV